MGPFIKPSEFSPKFFGTNVHILLGALKRQGVSVSADLADTPFPGVSITARNGDRLTIRAEAGKYASVTFLGALVKFSESGHFLNEGEWGAVVAAFFAPFWEHPEDHETIVFLKRNEGAMVTLLAQ